MLKSPKEKFVVQGNGFRTYPFRSRKGLRSPKRPKRTRFQKKGFCSNFLGLKNTPIKPIQKVRKKSLWCRGRDLNPRTPTRPGPKPGAFDQLGDPCTKTSVGQKKYNIILGTNYKKEYVAFYFLYSNNPFCFFFPKSFCVVDHECLTKSGRSPCSFKYFFKKLTVLSSAG